MKEAFIEKRFSASSLDIIKKADTICREYMAQGLTLTLRQLYYQFVSRDWLPNKQTEYKRLGSIINDARLAGMIDWEAMEDRTRNLESIPNWGTVSEYFKSVPYWFHYDMWKHQDNRLEVWIEKEALVGVIERVCNQYKVPYFACRGNSSQSEMYVAANRFAEHNENGQRTVVLHLGDHDPSGIDMTRDNAERLELFWNKNMDGTLVEVRRLALNMDQINRYKPPPNPAKTTDSRYTEYEKKFGDQSWELDALNPTVIRELLDTEISSYIDHDAWQEAQDREKEEKGRIEKFLRGWKDVE